MKREFIYIAWIDSTTVDGWIDPKEEPLSFSRIETIGQFVSEDEKGITVALSNCCDTGNVNLMLIIPKGRITDRRIISRPRGT